jgi:hypothetical protein
VNRRSCNDDASIQEPTPLHPIYKLRNTKDDISQLVIEKYYTAAFFKVYTIGIVHIDTEKLIAQL